VKVVDSSGWIEFFTDGPLASQFEPHLADPSRVITPTIVLYEVYKLIRRERGEEAGLVAAAAMERTRLAPLTETVALTAADLSLEHRLAMADAIVYATARLEEAEVVTADVDFRDLPGVLYFPKETVKIAGKPGRSRRKTKRLS
jgi:predicted nucleic acid-binding protein